MSMKICELESLTQQLNRTLKTLMTLLLAEKDHYTFLIQHRMLLLCPDSKLLSLIDTQLIIAIYEQLYKQISQLQYDFSNVLELLDTSLNQSLLSRIPNKANLVTLLQQSFVWKLDEEAIFLDLFALALPQLANPSFYHQVLAILAADTTIPEDFDLITLDKHLTACKPLEAYFYDLRILLACTASFVAEHPQLHFFLQHARSFEKDLELQWKVSSLEYVLETTTAEK